METAAAVAPSSRTSSRALQVPKPRQNFNLGFHRNQGYLAIFGILAGNAIVAALAVRGSHRGCKDWFWGRCTEESFDVAFRVLSSLVMVPIFVCCLHQLAVAVSEQPKAKLLLASYKQYQPFISQAKMSDFNAAHNIAQRGLLDPRQSAEVVLGTFEKEAYNLATT